MTELEASGPGEHPPPYIIFVVVFLFFLTGLLGFLVCHLLKKKGYRCRTGDMDDEEDGEDEKLGVNADEDEEHQDTVEQILKCIIENEANMEAFNEMLGNHNVCVRHDPRLRKESIGGIPPHHHTVHSGTDHNSCHLCAQVRSKKGRRQSRTPRSKQRPGEQTVFSVGRFRVTHHDKKLHGGPNPLVSSGDQLDQSQDSEERKEGGYNLRSMFKEVRSPPESSGGVAPNVGKRRRSLTIFGLRRGSDPTGVKAGEGTGRETGGVRFAIQQQPVVLEELLQAENIKIAPDRGTKPGIKPEAEPLKNQARSSPQHEASVSSQIQAHGSIPAPEGESTQGPGTEPRIDLVIKPSAGSAAASAPSSLPIPSAASSGQAFQTTEKRGDREDELLKEAYDPGPLQTSTPLSPTHRSIPAFTPVIPAGQPEPSSSKEFPVTQTPDLEPGSDAGPALISLGSSPPSSFQIKTPSSLSSTPISPLLGTSSSKTTLSPALTPSPKLPSGRATSNQSPVTTPSFAISGSPVEAQTPSPALTAGSKFNTSPVSPQTLSSSPAEQNLSIGSSPRLTLKSESVTSVTSQRGKVSSPISTNEQELEGTIIPKGEEKTEMKNVGILKTAKLSPAEGDYKASALFSPAHELSEDRPGIFPLSPLSPSSPIGSRVSNVTIIKASPDSRREFSVITMAEDEEPSTSIRDQKRETSEFEKEGSSPAVGHEGKVSVSGVEQFGEAPGTEERPTAAQEKDDMVEMEDIRDCKVTQSEEAKGADEESKKTGDV